MKLLLFLLLMFNISSYASNEINLSHSRLIQLATQLKSAQADSALKYDFSYLALLEMYNSYQHELYVSLEKQPGNLKKQAKLRHWRYAVQSYLKNLDHIFFQLDSGKPWDFWVNQQDKIIILIEGEQPVIISGPNNGANQQIESNIVEIFCRQYDCQPYFRQTETEMDKAALANKNKLLSQKPAILPAIDAQSSGLWSLKSNSQVYFISSNGIIFSFLTIKNRSSKENWALEIANEFDLLLSQFKTIQKKGFIIHWPSIKLEDLPVTDRAYKLIINNNNDFIKINIPLLAHNQEIFVQLMPEIQALVEKNKSLSITIMHAEKLFQEHL